MFENLQGSSLDRRSFLRGSAMFALAIGVSVLPAFAQQQEQIDALTSTVRKVSERSNLTNPTPRLIADNL